MREVLIACRNHFSSRIFLCSQLPDLLRTSCSPEIFREDSDNLFSGGNVSVDTLTIEKGFMSFSSISVVIGILSKSGQLMVFELLTDEAASLKPSVLDTVTLLNLQVLLSFCGDGGVQISAWSLPCHSQRERRKSHIPQGKENTNAETTI